MQSPKPLRNFHWQFFQMVWWIHVYYTITQNYFFFLLLVIDASRTKLATRWLVNFRFFIRSSGRYTLHIQIKKASKSVTSKRSIFQNVFHCNGSSSTIKRFLTVSSLKEFKIFDLCLAMKRASLVAQLVKNPPAVQETQETWAGSLGGEDSLKEEMATHSSILAWRIPCTEEPGRLQSMGLQESNMTEQLSTAQHRDN